MGDLFKALSSGLARFVYAWLVPSLITVGVFIVVLLPRLGQGFAQFGQGFGRLTIGGVAFYALAVIGLSVVFAYGSRPVFQFLEGYTMPKWLKKRLLRKRRRQYAHLRALQQVGSDSMKLEATERLKAYPDNPELIMPTLLGNALKAMESYGLTRYGLDSQTFWYELQSVANERVSRSTEETRAAVDFFMSSLAHLSLLAVVSLCAWPFTTDPVPIVITGLFCAALTPLAYLQAVRNVNEWRWSVQALVNTSRPALAQALVLSLPDSHEAEQRLWRAASQLVHRGTAAPKAIRVLDRYRAKPNYTEHMGR
jgi:hypothetical protein